MLPRQGNKAQGKARQGKAQIGHNRTITGGNGVMGSSVRKRDGNGLMGQLRVIAEFR